MVAKRAGAVPIDLDVLPHPESWSLFKKIAFDGRDKSEWEGLEDIAKKIEKKCGGLPLAIKAIANLLRCKENIEDWQKVMDSNMWKLEDKEIEIFPHLYLSFNGLSPQMKRCFLYCVVFPKDEKIKVDDLIRLWMAQGYLNSSKSEHEMEENGRGIFENLALRSFFQDFVKDDNGEQIISCKMHDIMHDFAQHLTKGECLIVDEIRNEICENVHHLTFSVNEGSTNECFGSNILQLRSFFTERLDLGSLITHLLNNLKRVRVLKLDWCNLKELPSGIGHLIHLRYLRMQGNYDLKKLPTTVYDLYNLQTLDVSDCKIDELPLGIEKLIGLRHLINSCVMKLPVGIGQIKCLQTLPPFKVEIGYIRLGDLKNLNQLRGSLTIHICSNLDDLVDAQNADLKSKKHIKDLEFKFKSSIIVTEDVIEALEPPPHLKSLGWFHYDGKRLPKWIMSLTNLKELSLDSCFNLVSLPPLGSLPCLEKLDISSVDELEVLGASFLGINEPSLPLLAIGFPKLTYLTFSKCQKWKEWEDIGRDDETVAVMPRLRRLKISKCEMLKALPLRLLRKMSLLEYIEVDSKYSEFFNDDKISASIFFAIAETLGEIIDGQSKHQSPSTKEASHSQIKPTHPTLQSLIYSNDKKVLRQACLALFFLSRDVDNKVQALIEAGVCQRLVELLFNPSRPVAIAALQMIENIVRGDYNNIQSIIHQILHDLQNCFLTHIQKERWRTWGLACKFISVLIARNNGHIQDVIDAGLIPTLVNILLRDCVFYPIKEAARAIMNATSGATYEQIKFLESQGCVKVLCDLLSQWDDETDILFLQGLENFLEMGEVEKNLRETGDLNYFAQLIDEVGGLERIKNLQSHRDTEIREKAGKILDTYWVEKDGTSPQGN